MEHQIPITNGKGSKELDNATYTVTTEATGYDISSITPAEVTIEEGTNNYEFTISATGTLTLHVTDDGTEIGIPVVGATFHRCDADGTPYGDAITSNDEGNAVFNNVPFAETDAPNVYYKQDLSDGEHIFSSDLQTVTLTEESITIEVENTMAESREFTLTDAYYSGLPIENANLTLTSQ